jgi:hypothetical protein
MRKVKDKGTILFIVEKEADYITIYDTSDLICKHGIPIDVARKLADAIYAELGETPKLFSAKKAVELLRDEELVKDVTANPENCLAVKNVYSFAVSIINRYRRAILERLGEDT